jgi:putative DNA primase/helicase
MISGDPGCGKSQFLLWLAARLVSGDPFPMPNPHLRTYPSRQGQFLYVSSEDSPSRTIKPRLLAAGCDPSQVVILEGMREKVSDDDPKSKVREFRMADVALIERVLSEGKFSAVGIDPVTTHLGNDVDSNSNSEVSNALKELPPIADRTGTAFLLVRHRAKRREGPSKLSGMGATAFQAISRAELMLGEHPDIDGEWIISHAKYSIAERSRPLHYRIVPQLLSENGCDIETSRFEYVGVANVDAEAALQNDDSATPRQEADDFIHFALDAGPIPSSDFDKKAKDAGISAATLRRARKTLGVSAFRHGERWCVKLPTTD